MSRKQLIEFKIDSVIKELGDNIFRRTKKTILYIKCSTYVNYERDTIKKRLSEHLNSAKRKKHNTLQSQTLLFENGNDFDKEMVEAFTSADILLEKLNNEKLRLFLEKYMKKLIKSVPALWAHQKLSSTQ
ncbi:uncharacterized protein LOC111616521 [Centruroides sculpturatus]|uniref:uncharacterized protein LOC111616521 n=1 Tax=Centruroides sculpturatus TaxID=218467 RepID=UPI000C6C9B8F|nr:uncharacterized protein LOC111616521 [Centruroides sculpturatus]